MTKNTIGQFISALRRASGMTQQDLADRLNVSNKAVSRWERDECAPDLSLIPAIAEIFGVTCDELLKGERIQKDESSPEKREPKVEKQVKALLNKNLYSFRLMSVIASVLASAGFLLMLAISYGFYRPLIGIFVQGILSVSAIAVAGLAVHKIKSETADNELLELADPNRLADFNSKFGSLAFRVFFCIATLSILTLPLLIGIDENYHSVLTIKSYLLFFFPSILMLLALCYMKLHKVCAVWIAEGTPPSLRRPDTAEKVSLLQIALTAASAIIFFVASFLPFMWSEIPYTVLVAVGLCMLAANIIVFVVFISKNKENRKAFILPGIRNMLFIPAAVISADIHGVVYFHEGGASHYWDPATMMLTAVCTLAVALIFEIIIAIKKNSTKH